MKLEIGTEVWVYPHNTKVSNLNILELFPQIVIGGIPVYRHSITKLMYLNEQSLSCGFPAWNIRIESQNYIIGTKFITTMQFHP